MGLIQYEMVRLERKSGVEAVCLVETNRNGHEYSKAKLVDL